VSVSPRRFEVNLHQEFSSVYTLSIYIPSHLWKVISLYYTAKNDQVVAILMKTGLNNVVRPTLFTIVNNIEQYCYTRFRLNNIVQYCWQVWTMWAAQHCSILLNSRLIIFTRVPGSWYLEHNHACMQNEILIMSPIFSFLGVSGKRS
jgi:hypothetical protein